MSADGAPDTLVGFSERQHAIELVHLRSDRKNEPDASFRRTLEHGVKIIGKCGIIEMTMTVDDRHRKRSHAG
jgi:hypothetical protein